MYHIYPWGIGKFYNSSHMLYYFADIGIDHWSFQHAYHGQTLKYVILANENTKYSKIQSNGFSFSFGFDYLFENNFLAGLYYSSINGSLSGSRVDDLNSTGFDVYGNSTLLNFSFGYEF